MADKIRIMDHVNRDHKLALYDYLAHYKNIHLSLDDPFTTVELRDISLDALTIWYANATHTRTTTIPIAPAMAHLSDARAVLKRMARHAALAQGHEPVRLTHYACPRLFVKHPVARPANSTPSSSACGSSSCCVRRALARLARINLLYPASYAVSLLWLTPVFPSSLMSLWATILPARLTISTPATARKIAYWLMLCHCFEVLFLLTPLLRRARVPQPQRTLWSISNLLEGFPAILRLRREIAANRRAYDV